MCMCSFISHNQSDCHNAIGSYGRLWWQWMSRIQEEVYFVTKSESMPLLSKLRSNEIMFLSNQSWLHVIAAVKDASGTDSTIHSVLVCFELQVRLAYSTKAFTIIAFFKYCLNYFPYFCKYNSVSFKARQRLCNWSVIRRRSPWENSLSDNQSACDNHMRGCGRL